MSVVSLKKILLEKNEDAINMVEGLLERLKNGEAVAVGLVEVKKGDTVATGFASGGRYYHQLNSGAATLAQRLASQED